MHTVIINGSPRSNTTSNTKNIINSFLKGYIKKGNTYEIYNIADNTQWEKARKAFYSSENIIIATPLFAESLPGILIAFLESLAINPDDKSRRKLSFILQSGLFEGCQRKCCEQLLEKIPKFLNCEYAGTLSKGDMFVTFLLPVEKKDVLLAPFESMGELFAEKKSFIGCEFESFRDVEYMSESQAKIWNRITKFAMYEFAEYFGCKTDLLGKPYETIK